MHFAKIWVWIIGIVGFSCAVLKTHHPFPAGQTDRCESLDRPFPIDPAIRTGVLENGLRYLIRKNRKPEKRAFLRLIIDVGSVLEEEGEEGFAHFTEHMAFNGTRHFPKQALVDYLESIGMRFGPEINASTGFDETVYRLEVPTDSLEYLEQAFLILSDWASGILFDPEETEKERGVLIEEWRIGRGPETRIFDRHAPVLFRDSRYASRLPIGKKEVLETCTPEALRAFYRKWYRPDLMTVIAVGDFEATHIEDLIRIYFTGIPRPPDPFPRPRFSIPAHPETFVSIVAEKEASRTRVSVYFKRPFWVPRTLGDYRRLLLEELYDALFNQRLLERQREPNPPFLSAVAGFGRLGRAQGIYTITVTVDEGKALTGLEAVLAEAERVRRHGFTPTELERAKQEMLRTVERSLRERDKTPSSMYVSEYTRHVLYGEPIPGVDCEWRLTRRFLPEIGLEELQALAVAVATDTNRVVLIDGPPKEEAPLPDEAAILSLFEAVKGQDLPVYRDEIFEAPLLGEIPQPGRIVLERGIDSLDVIEWVLSTGLRVVLKPTPFKNDEVLFEALSPGGTSLAPDSLYVSAALATSLVNESGYGPFTRTALEKRLSGKIVRVTPTLGAYGEGLSGSASPEDLRTLFELIHLVFTQPRLDSTAFLSLKERLSGLVRNRGAHPEAAFADTIQVIMANRHPRARPWTESLLAELHPHVAYHFYRDRFAESGDFVFVFVGNFNPDSLRCFVKTFLGGLPSIGRRESWKDLGIVPPDGPLRKVVHRGVEPKAQVRLVWAGEEDFSFQAEEDLKATVDLLRIRLREVLREGLGGTYGVSVYGSLIRIPRPRYEAAIAFGCAPERVEALIDTVRETLHLLASEGADASEIQKVQMARIREYEHGMKENAFWLRLLVRAYQHNDDLPDLLRFAERIRAFSNETVRRVIRDQLDPQEMICFILLPETEGGLRNHERRKSP